RCRPRDSSDCRTGPQSRPARHRRAYRGAGGGAATRTRSGAGRCAGALCPVAPHRYACAQRRHRRTDAVVLQRHRAVANRSRSRPGRGGAPAAAEEAVHAACDGRSRHPAAAAARRTTLASTTRIGRHATMTRTAGTCRDGRLWPAGQERVWRQSGLVCSIRMPEGGLMVATDLQSDLQTDSDMAATQAALDRIAPVLDRIGDCFYALDTGWRIVHFNAAAEYWFELKRASVIGRSFFDVFSPVRSSVVAEYCRAVFETGREIEREMDSIVNPRRRAMLRIFPLGPGIGIVISDRTGERDLRMALERSEVRLRRLADSNQVGIAVTDADGHILEANDAYLAMTGYSRRELDDGLANWATVTPPEYADVEAAHLAQADADGVCDAYEKEYIRRDGSRVPVFIRFARLQQ